MVTWVQRLGSPCRERTPRSLERRHPAQAPRRLIVIVCPAEAEGYFKNLVEALQLTSRVQIFVVRRSGLMEQMVEALTLSHSAPPHHRLFALLDCEVPPHCGPLESTEGSGAGETVEDIRKIAQYHHLAVNRIVRLIVSAPGFVFWLLLHFEEEVDLSGVPPHRWREEMLAKLAAFIPDMTGEEADRKIFSLCQSRISQAMLRSQRQGMDNAHGLSPYTEIHELVHFLLKLQERDTRHRA